ncbi:MAG: hypothetical protein ACYS0E_12015 [Planctomycetota bacterium]|jgi:hypothetical protein
MRTTIALMLASLFVQAQETKVNEDVVKAVRYVVSAKKAKEREKYYKALFERTDLDWPSVKQGLMTGRYYSKPLSTELGIRHSGKHMGIRLRGPDGKERGFTVYVPQGYTADDKQRIPVLMYLHHHAGGTIDSGASKADIGLRKFDDLCEKYNVLFVAPYTGKGAEWWTEGGVQLIQWTLEKVKSMYNIDEDKVGLIGPLDAADAVWYVAQRMPGTWNVLMPLSGDPYEATAIVRPIYLGTIDRMDILMGVPGKLRTRFGDKDVHGYLDWLRPHFDKRLRLTLSIQMGANSDAHYLDLIRDQAMNFLVTDVHKRKALANEVDVETDGPDGLRSLWLSAKGYDADVKPPRARKFPSTRLVWTPPKAKEPQKKLGINLDKRDWPIGQVITRTSLGAERAKINNGDVLLEVNGTPIHKDTKVLDLIKDLKWNDEVEVLLAREVDSNGLKGAQRQQRQYLQIREKIKELRAAGKPIPADTSELLEDEEEEEEAEDEDEDDGESVIEMGGEPEEEEAGDGNDVQPKRKETTVFIFRRWIKVLRPEGVLIRKDFGATWDRQHRDPVGVRMAHVAPGSLAARSGFKNGDVIIQVLGEPIKRMADLRKAFAKWKFEKEPEGERSVTFDIRRMTKSREWIDEAVTVRWEAPKPYRVDAKWNKNDKQLNILVRHASQLTVYLTDELIKPGEAFHVFVNGVPYHDLLDPASRPEYPRPRHGAGGDRLFRMRMARAKIAEGWKPDFKLAVDDALARRDRSVVIGAKLEIDLSKHKAGLEGSRKFHGKPRKKKGEKLKTAYDEHKSGAKAPG